MKTDLSISRLSLFNTDFTLKNTTEIKLNRSQETTIGRDATASEQGNFVFVRES